MVKREQILEATHKAGRNLMIAFLLSMILASILYSMAGVTCYKESEGVPDQYLIQNDSNTTSECEIVSNVERKREQVTRWKTWGIILITGYFISKLISKR